MRRLGTARISTTPFVPGRMLTSMPLIAWLLIATGLALAYQASSIGL